MDPSHRRPVPSRVQPAPPLPPRPVPSRNTADVTEGLASMSLDSARPPPLPPRKPSNSPYASAPSGQPGSGNVGAVFSQVPVDANQNHHAAVRRPPESVVAAHAHNTAPTNVLLPVPSSPPAIRCCPNRYPIYFATRWYSMPGLPEMRACSKCCEMYIRTSPFANQFSAVDEPAGEARVCKFNTPRLLQLWSQAVASGNVETAKQFIEMRAKVPGCPGKSVPNLGGKWFIPTSGSIPNFLACEACYYDIILATNFSSNFQACASQQSRDAERVCSLSLPFMPRAIQAYSQTNAWNEFARVAVQRLNMQLCPDQQAVQSSSRKWLRPKASIPGMSICETCYFDWAACSGMGTEFEYVQGNHRENWSCDMAILPIKAAMIEATLSNSYQMWWDVAKPALSSPNCSRGDIKDGVWYTLLQDPQGFDICPACYAGLIYITGMGIHFKSRSYPRGTTKACSFNTSSKRFRNYMLKLVEATETYRFNIFTDYVQKVSHLPVCPGRDSIDHARWYGNTEYLFCPECYETEAKGTPFASSFPHVNSLLEPAYICSLASPRMRKLWSEAIAKYDDRDFARFAVHRAQTWIQTIGECNNILLMMRMRMQQKQTLQMASLMVGGASNIEAAASGGSHGRGYYEYGNSTVGYGYSNSAGVDGAMYAHQASGVSVLGGGGDLVRVGQLEALWNKVE